MSGSTTNILTRTKRLTVLLAAVGLLFSAAKINGQSIEAPSKEVASSQDAKTGTTQAARNQTSGVEILSDTLGVDFGPYLRKAVSMIRKTWYSLNS